MPEGAYIGYGTVERTRGGGIIVSTNAGVGRSCLNCSFAVRHGVHSSLGAADDVQQGGRCHDLHERSACTGTARVLAGGVPWRRLLLWIVAVLRISGRHAPAITRRRHYAHG